MLLLTTLSGCADFGYLMQSANGHLTMMRAARPIGDWQGDPQTSPELKARLALAQKIRRFAATDLALPDNASYTRYADLKRRAVVWNVVAAPATSLTLKTWCFPVTGCIGYRGYFEEEGAKAVAAELKAQGLEVSVYGVPAYSTLGWLNWAGGDPLLNTFINYSEAELARLIFHELAHQVAFAKDDTMFNESFATAVERIGGQQWLATLATANASDEFNANSVRRTQFRALTLATRGALNDVYGSTKPEEEMLARKSVVYLNFRAQYAALRTQWVANSNLTEQTAARQLGGYDQWVANANNASFAAQAAYDELVPEFESLYAQLARQPGPAWQRFYDAVKRLAEMPKAERRAALKNPTILTQQ
jgi:predicted aminopeptidase